MLYILEVIKLQDCGLSGLSFFFLSLSSPPLPFLTSPPPVQFVEPTGKRFLLAIDVSGSMTCFNVLGSTSISARVASAAMAMVTARTESNYHMVGFSDKLVPLNINAKMSLAEVMKNIEKVRLLWEYVQIQIQCQGS